MKYNGIFRVLSEQDDERVQGLIRMKNSSQSKYDIANKMASYDAMSYAEKEEVFYTNRQKVFFSKRCLWDGKRLDLILNKTGKEKNYCDAHCNRQHNVFTTRLNTDYFESLDPRIQIFREYCLVQMIFRTPGEGLYKRIKKITRREGTETLSKNTPLLLKTLTIK